MQAEQFEVVSAIDRSHWWFTGRQAIVRDLLETVLEPRPDALVVDVGCGPGATIASLSDRYEVIGIDQAPEAIDHARRRFGDVRFICGDAPDDLAERIGDVDAYLLMDVLEHVEADRELLAAIVGSLPVGGHVLITVPADMRLWSEQDVQLGHHRRYDAASARSLWSELPVSEVMLSHFNTRLYPLILLLRTVSRLTGRAWGEAGSDMRIPREPVNSVLRRLFTGEGRRLRSVATDGARPYRRGVSLVAILRREPDDDRAGTRP